ncbi:arylamine N-acetyltransferase [Paenibacillus rigui]|uniref:Arylamine N-acetyltransferase n=1 Tax=Paenibacillus rigui TaxID=554312 RepID=A0A229UIC3_9BACL|nr:arylamine N-acetyltransferase [Paenibacillus rigui]OXM82659.1 hypothetical protein CF651_29840 [Paenibacillus rigui]
MMNEKSQTRYLSLLQMERRAPSLDYLRVLTKHHLHRFPFENISKIYYYASQASTGQPWLPAIDTFLDHFERHGLGGNCYILNVHFGQLLDSLGFQTELVRATGGNVHLANRVTVEGRSYYVDVGYGAPLFEPLSLEEQPRFSRCGEEVEIMKLKTNRYMIDRRANGQSLVTKYIEWCPVSLESFEEAITHSLRDEDDNPFMRKIIATLYKQEVAYSVINQKLLIRTDDRTEVHEYTEKRQWMHMMRITFGFTEEMLLQALEFVESRAGASPLFVHR